MDFTDFFFFSPLLQLCILVNIKNIEAIGERHKTWQTGVEFSAVPRDFTMTARASRDEDLKAAPGSREAASLKDSVTLHAIQTKQQREIDRNPKPSPPVIGFRR